MRDELADTAVQMVWALQSMKPEGYSLGVVLFRSDGDKAHIRMGSDTPPDSLMDTLRYTLAQHDQGRVTIGEERMN